MSDLVSKRKTYRFDQMAKQINDRVDNPAESGVEKYIGLEHLDAESLRISRWGDITDVESTKLRFYPGDIIFGKRRVYQRKLAVADFEGICSAHAMVLRAKPDVALPEFLPFFMQSERFMERALAISVGSLSPTINWTDLAREEFALPSIEEQQEIVSITTASLNAFESANKAALVLLELRRSTQNRLLFPSQGMSKRNGVHLSDIASINPSESAISESDPFIPMEALDEWERDITRIEKKGTRGGVRARGGDVLMARITPCLENGKIAQVPKNIEACGGSTEFVVIRANQTVSASYLYWLITSDRIRNASIAMMYGSTGRQRVSGKDIGDILIPPLRPEEQQSLGLYIDDLEDKRKQMADRAKQAKVFHFRLINKLLGGQRT
jgi:restriction endonuclease S subunit